ncbi:MAG: right-handed parallel beta-helix repeat-containing protein [Paludibacteraceae bacterium]|nr:right-handed parallel beta-helix repeat-containing protein [Paludibacteraceae bacterium]
MRRITILMSVLLAAGSLYAQADKTYQAEDNRQRGYYNRPWLRYEAETGKCQTNATVLPASTANANIQSEATNQVAVNLVNQGDYIQWTCEQEANAVTIRFSLPDNATSSVPGTGTTGNLGLYVNDQKMRVYQATRTTDGINLSDNILLDSYWAWQYFNGYEDVAFETKTGSILRMRFDEVILRTENNIPAGTTLKIVKEDDNTNPYTIDFLELEKTQPVTYESISGAKVKYEGDGSNLQDFVNSNSGKIIYLPQGKYKVPVRLNIPVNTTLQGAGVFYTELFFNAPLDDANYQKRGVTSSSSNVKVDGMYLNGIQNQRYYQRNASKQPGKGFNGSFGSNSIISNVLVQHFECGAWLENANELHISNSRFRNNYADGTNLASASKNCIVEYCSYRNNGDDDMASWSRAGLAQYVKFRYNISECNWRASAIGIFGGKGHQVEKCLVVDALEGGLRLSAEFSGAAFNETDYMCFSDLSFYNCGSSFNGTIYGKTLPTILIEQKNKYVRNVRLKKMDLYNNKNVAISISSNSDKEIKSVCFEDVNINVATAGIYVGSKVCGMVNHNEIYFNDCNKNITNIASPEKFILCNLPCGESCSADAIFVPLTDGSFVVSAENGYIEVAGADADSDVLIYNTLGQKVADKKASGEGVVAFDLNNGTYIVVNNNNRVKVTF